MAIIWANNFATGVIADEPSTNAGLTIASDFTKDLAPFSAAATPITTGTAFGVFEGYAATGVLTSLGLAPLYTNVSIYFVTLPSAEEVIFRSRTGAGFKQQITIDASGILRIYTGGSVLVATGTHALVTGRWYDLGVKSSNGTSSAYDVQIDGVSEFSGNMNQGASNVATIAVGKAVNLNGSGYDMRIGSIIMDDAGFNYGQHVTFSPVLSNGSPMQWASGTGPSNYTQINESPKSLTDYVMSTGAANDVARFKPTPLTTLGITGATIKSVLTQIYVRENTNVTTLTKMRMVSGATTTDGTAVDPASTAQLLGAVFNTDPNTGAAWSEGNVNAIEFGAIETNAVQTRMVWAGVYIVSDKVPVFNTSNMFLVM